MAGQAVHAKADSNGQWRVDLPAAAPGGPYEIKVSGSEIIEIKDVLAGEVWLCSGQSNMEWPLELSKDSQTEIPAANYPTMRLFTVPRTYSLQPQARGSGTWGICEPANASKFSAVAYYFGRELHRRLKVPIGLINASWGGTRAEAWTSLAGLNAESALKDVVAEVDDAMSLSPNSVTEKYKKLRAEWYRKLPQDSGNRGLAEGWAATSFNDNAWKTMRLPEYWQNAGHPTNGVFWFRLAVNIPAEWAGRDLQLSLGALDKSDDTYWNGTRVGGMSWADEPNSWNICRTYQVPAASVRPGKNVLAVRVLSNFTGGGIVGPGSDMFVLPQDARNTTKISLVDEWRYCIEQDYGRITSPPEPQPPVGANTATALFNGMLQPLIPFALRGVIWYQGESNASNAERYRVLFPRMIRDWREHWQQREFPFYFVQLANYGNTDLLAKGTWAQLRESQAHALTLPNTGMAVTIDIGEAGDIHPRNKKDVGLRLALNALAKTYEQKVNCHGPRFRSFKADAGAIRITFDHADGLKATGELNGFVLAGADRSFRVANAQIDGAMVVVSHPEVKTPAAVRYGWADSPTCTLYNGEGLPAEPFRTDDWPL
jgi:sialate O-acetylesterase